MSKDDDPERTVFRPTGTSAPTPGWRKPAEWRPDAPGKPGSGWGESAASNKPGDGWGAAPAPHRTRQKAEFVAPPFPDAEVAPPSRASGGAGPRFALVGTALLVLAAAALWLTLAPGEPEDSPGQSRGGDPRPAAAAAAPPTATAMAVPDQPGAPSPLPAEAPPLPVGSFSFPGAPADAYARLVQPACQAAIENRYPFFGNAGEDAAPGEVRRLFGPGGMLPSFVGGTLAPLIATDGPVWRWRPSGAAAAFDPATPETLARLPALTGLIGEGLSFEVEPIAFGGGVTAVELGLPGSRQRFDGPGPASRVQWRLPAQAADSTLVLIKDGRPVRRYQEGGFWSPFRLIDKGRSASEPGGATLVTFSDGTHSATLRLRATSGGQPFGRGGLWAFRCPAKL